MGRNISFGLATYRKWCIWFISFRVILVVRWCVAMATEDLTWSASFLSVHLLAGECQESSRKSHNSSTGSHTTRDKYDYKENIIVSFDWVQHNMIPRTLTFSILSLHGFLFNTGKIWSFMIILYITQEGYHWTISCSLMYFGLRKSEHYQMLASF